MLPRKGVQIVCRGLKPHEGEVEAWFLRKGAIGAYIRDVESGRVSKTGRACGGEVTDSYCIIHAWDDEVDEVRLDTAWGGSS